jgi:hypothetical protein
VAGFLFRNNDTEVALIRKNKPDWQKGKLNGIGGKEKRKFGVFKVPHHYSLPCLND